MSVLQRDRDIPIKAIKWEVQSVFNIYNDN